jgi:hypothetical protein
MRPAKIQRPQDAQKLTSILTIVCRVELRPDSSVVPMRIHPPTLTGPQLKAMKHRGRASHDRQPSTPTFLSRFLQSI